MNVYAYENKTVLPIEIDYSECNKFKYYIIKTV